MLDKSIDLINLLKNIYVYEQKFSKLCNISLSVIQNKKKIIFCGNGGSAAEAQHLSAELVGRFKYDRPALPSISITTDTSIITAVGNDFGYEKIFERQLESIGNEGDLLILLSSSGNSKNLILANKIAKKMGIYSYALLGKSGGSLKEIADQSIIIENDSTDRIQEMHLFLGHLLCEYLEKEFFKL